MSDNWLLKPLHSPTIHCWYGRASPIWFHTPLIGPQCRPVSLYSQIPMPKSGFEPSAAAKKHVIKSDRNTIPGFCLDQHNTRHQSSYLLPVSIPNCCFQSLQKSNWHQGGCIRIGKVLTTRTPRWAKLGTFRVRIFYWIFFSVWRNVPSFLLVFPLIYLHFPNSSLFSVHFPHVPHFFIVFHGFPCSSISPSSF